MTRKPRGLRGWHPVAREADDGDQVVVVDPRVGSSAEINAHGFIAVNGTTKTAPGRGPPTRETSASRRGCDRVSVTPIVVATHAEANKPATTAPVRRHESKCGGPRKWRAARQPQIRCGSRRRVACGDCRQQRQEATTLKRRCERRESHPCDHAARAAHGRTAPRRPARTRHARPGPPVCTGWAQQ